MGLSWLLLCVMAFNTAFDAAAPNVQVPGMFAFGDSIVDQGNNNDLKTAIKSNFPPYGKDFPGGVATGRFSNGRTPPDMFAEAFGVAQLVRAYSDPHLTTKDFIKGVSFASAGSGYDPQTPRLMSVTPLSDQLKHFKDYIGKLKGAIGDDETNRILNNSVHLVSSGSNDLAINYFTIGSRRLQYNIPSYVGLLVSSASTFVQELYLLGARKLAVLGIPPIGCLPAERTLAGGIMKACKEEYNMAAKLFNSKLSLMLDSLDQNLPQAKFIYLDVYNPLLNLIQHPHNHGFEVIDRGCCGTGTLELGIFCNELSRTCLNDSSYIFWDSFHPTERAYKFLVDEIITENINKFQ